MPVRFVDEAGGRMAVLPEAEYRRLVEAADERAAVAAYDGVKYLLRTGQSELVPDAMVERLLAGESKIRVWREHRGLSVEALAGQAGIAAAELERLESDVRGASVETGRQLARALGLAIDDLV